LQNAEFLNITADGRHSYRRNMKRLGPKLNDYRCRGIGFHSVILSLANCKKSLRTVMGCPVIE